MNKPKVSIIVPCYGVEKYLDRCMESIVNQTLKDIEIILVDDGSPDRVPQMCDNWAKKDSRIKVIHKKNAGLGYARNSGLDIATGEYVAFVDSDDFVDTKMYKLLYEHAKLNDLDTCYCGYSYFDGSKETDRIETLKKNTFYKGRENVDSFLFSLIGMPSSSREDHLINVCVWRAIYSMKIIEKNNLRFVSEREISSEDIVFHADYLPNALSVGYLPLHLYKYRYNPNSISHSYPIWKRNALINNALTIYDKLSEHYKYEEFIVSWSRLAFRDLKILLNREALQAYTFSQKYKNIKNILDKPIFSRMFTVLDYHKLPTSLKALFLMSKYKMICLIIISLKLLRK